MEKRVIIIASFMLLFISLAFTSCQDPKKQSPKTASNVISEIKTSACNTADKAGTCYSRLPELGIISPEECCEQLGKCCKEGKNEN